jgi:hypothetical protein
MLINVKQRVSTGNAVTGSERSELFPPYAQTTKMIKRAYAREPVTAFPVLTRPALAKTKRPLKTA